MRLRAEEMIGARPLTRDNVFRRVNMQLEGRAHAQLERM